MTSSQDQPASWQALEKDLLRKIGIPAESKDNAHQIRPSSVSVFLQTLNEAIFNLDQPEEMKVELRKAAGAGFCNPYTFMQSNLTLTLPDTIQELKQTIATIAESFKECAQERRVSRSVTPVLYRACLEGFNKVLEKEGLPEIKQRRTRAG